MNAPHQLVPETVPTADPALSYRPAPSGGEPFAGRSDAAGADAERTYPLSPAQQRLWFIEQLQPGSVVYSLPVAWRLAGTLEAGAFEWSVNELVRRHAALRTVFSMTDGRPAQKIRPFQPWAIPVSDLRGVQNPEERARQLVEAEVRTPFDLERGPVFRARLLRLGETEHLALFNAHHIVWDGWSINVFRRELGELYAARLASKAPALPDLPLSYAEWAAGQDALAADAAWDEPLGYWRQQLQGVPALQLPGDHPSPGLSPVRGAVELFELSEALIQSLRALGRAQGATLFMTLLAGFKAALHRHTGQEDMLIGSATAGRDGAQTENLVGFFVNMLPLRTRLDGDPPFTELLRRVRDTTLGAYAHQETPFEKIVKVLQPERPSAGHTPLVRVLVGFESGCARDWMLGGLRARVVEIETVAPKFDWTILLEETGCGLKGRLEYNTDLFGAESIKGFLRHFKILLEGAAAGPAQRLSRLPILDETERGQVLRDWNRTETDYERDACIHELFERQADRRPEAVALELGSSRLTYGQLNGLAGRLASRLKSLGVGPGVRVGLCMERSMEMIMAMLAILKAGGAYVPLDPASPGERLEFMLQDAQARLLLTQTRLRGRFSNPNLNILCLDPGWDADPERGAGLPIAGAPVSPEQLAYIIFTSGSTGRPKGVAVPHRGVVRLVRNTNYLEFSPEDVFLQFVSISFDVSTFEIWGPLLNGARLVICPPGLPSLRELGGIIRQSRITTLWLTAGLFHQMIDEQIEDLRGVRRLLAGGDVLSVPHVLKALRQLPGCEIINGYGPTENTTFSTCWRAPADWSGARSVPIGRPIANSTAFVLDQHLAPVPVGVAGELCVGGDGAACGYWNRPELTAEKFVPNPFGPASNPGRLYRTGDLARWLPDGNLEFLGRRDGQVKIRGFRVEPGEIEAALGRHPRVRQAAVVVRNQGLDKRLVACVVPAGQADQDLLAGQLRDFLKQALPDYMIPPAFSFREALPLMANGKIDRRALAQEEALVRPAPRALQPPRTEMERKLGEIWSEVLGREAVGVQDNFFQLGGHSLLAMQMAARIGRAFQVEVPVRAIFEAPTIEALAGIVARTARAGAAAPAGIARRIRRASALELLDTIDELSDAQVEMLLAAPELNQS